MLKHLILFVIFFLIIESSFSQKNDDKYYDLEKEELSSNDLLRWTFLGKGEIINMGEQICLKENDESSGVMLVSPKSYSENIILKFKVLALTSASVIAVILSGSDTEKSDSLTIPADYDGSFNLWYEEKQNYFFAFKNASHGLTPFVRKNPSPETILASAPDNGMVAGIYYVVEIGRQGSKLWLSINNELIFKANDEDRLPGGHIAIRIRGTAGFRGACLIKDLVVYTD